MQKLKAVYYGKIELVPGVKCDGYILSDGTACLSERGTADLLGMKQESLQSMTVTGLPNQLKLLIDKDCMKANLVKVTTNNSPYKSKKITVYDSKCIGSLMRAYALANGNNVLQKNEINIGQRCIILLVALVRTALESSIKQTCNFNPNI